MEHSFWIECQQVYLDIFRIGYWSQNFEMYTLGSCVKHLGISSRENTEPTLRLTTSLQQCIQFDTQALGDFPDGCDRRIDLITFNL